MNLVCSRSSHEYLLQLLTNIYLNINEILSSDSTPGIMIWHSVIKELENQKTKIGIVQEQHITINHAEFPIKRKSKFASRNFRENGENRKKFTRAIVLMMTKQNS